MIPLWKGKNPICFGVITIIPFDDLYRQAYFVMHTFLVNYEFVLLIIKSVFYERLLSTYCVIDSFKVEIFMKSIQLCFQLIPRKLFQSFFLQIIYSKTL
jgi:hypothetical protein